MVAAEPGRVSLIRQLEQAANRVACARRRWVDAWREPERANQLYEVYQTKAGCLARLLDALLTGDRLRGDTTDT